MIERDDFIETLARAICTIDPLSPRPDAPIMWGMKRAKAWEPRAAILRQAIDAGLFSHPPKVWLAPVGAMEVAAIGAMVERDFPLHSWSIWSAPSAGDDPAEKRPRPSARIWGDDGPQWFSRGDTPADALRKAYESARDAHLKEKQT